MKCWILYDIKQYRKNIWFAEHLYEILSEKCDAKVIITEKLIFGYDMAEPYFIYEGIKTEPPDFAISRTIFPLLSKAIEDSGGRVFNTAFVSEICNDKRKTYEFVSRGGIEFLSTVFCEKRFFNIDCFSDYGFPLILKSVSGHGGSEVFLVKDAFELQEKTEKIQENGFLLQKVCNTTGRDIRVYVLGSEILCAVERSSETFKSNFSLGGKAKLYNLSECEKNLVMKVISLFPCTLDLVGIDFLPDNGKLYFNEIEDAVGCRMIYKVTDIDIAAKYVNYISAKLNI